MEQLFLSMAKIKNKLRPNEIMEKPHFHKITFFYDSNLLSPIMPILPTIIGSMSYTNRALNGSTTDTALSSHFSHDHEGNLYKVKV